MSGIGLIASLAYGESSLANRTVDTAWRKRLDDPIRRFRQVHAWDKVRAIVRELAIPAPDDTDDQNAIVAEILRRAPWLVDK